MLTYRTISSRSISRVAAVPFLGLVIGCAATEPPPVVTHDCAGAGAFDLAVPLGAVALDGWLDLVCLDGRPWGRLRVALPSDTLSAAVARPETVGDTLRFMAGGALTGLDLIVGQSDSFSGVIRFNGGRQFPFNARRREGVATYDFAIHAQLAPWRAGEVSSDSGESYPVVASDGTVFFTRHGAGLTPQRLMVLAPGTRVARTLLEQTDGVTDRSPFLIPDGSRLVFSSNRDPSDAFRAGDAYRLWYVEREQEGWSPPRPLEWTAGDTPVNPQQPSVTMDDMLYFVDDRENGSGGRDVYVAHWDGSTVDDVHPVGAPINDAGDQTGVHVTAAGDLMIVGSTRGAGNQGGDDLYWSRRTSEGWSPPRNFGPPINSFGNEYGAWLDRDGRRLWFASDRYGWADIFMVDLASIGVSMER